MKSNCKFEDIVSVYNTLPPHEKLFLGNKFIDSPNTVFRYADIRNAEYAGFVELYDMKRNYGSHKGEVIIEVAICPQYRSIGILELLQSKAEEFVRSSTKYNKIVWYAKDANGRSIRCAEKLGYKKKFHESDHWVYEKVISSTIHEDVLSLYFYHASTEDYSKKGKLTPKAPNYGTNLYNPHWAVYMWKDKSIGYLYALDQIIRPYMKFNFKKEYDEKVYEYLDHGGKIYIATKDLYTKIKEYCLGKIVYLYTLEVPVEDFAHIRLGHTNRFPEYSIDKEIKIANQETIVIDDDYFNKYTQLCKISDVKNARKRFNEKSKKHITNPLYLKKKDMKKVAWKYWLANEYGLLDKNKDLNEVLSNDELIIKAFNKELDKADYGILINGKIYTDDDIDWSKYKTISPSDFNKYFVGTCWDYTEYEADMFEYLFDFKHTLNDLKEKEYSMYYMQIDDNNKCPTHTWITYKLNGRIYLFESSWKKYQGITKYNTEEEMMKDYIKKHKAFHKAKDNPIIVTKYNRNTKFGLTPNQFMRGCIKEGKVIYSEIPSISVDESYVKISLHENFNDSLSVYNQLSDDEKKLLSPRGKFIDSPNLIYRYNHLVNGKSVGFIEVYKLNGNSNSTGFITLAIAPKYRSKGISYVLIKKAIDGCKSKGYSKLIYRIDNSNVSSRAVAEKNGFILNHQGKNYSEYYLIIK